MNALRSERGSVLLGGLTKLALLLVVVGLIAYDGVAIGYARFSSAEHGKAAADKAGDVWRETGDIRSAYEAAQAKLDVTGETIDAPTFSIERETDTVSFRLTATAHTLVAQRLGFTKPMTLVDVEIVTDSAAPSS